MSKASYKRNPNIIRIVKYSLNINGTDLGGEYVCYEKTDDAAIKSAYTNLVWAWHPDFRVIEIIKRE